MKARAKLAAQKFSAVSLFTGAGIGDVGFRDAGIKFIATCEVEPARAALAELNLPSARHFTQDIHDAAKPLCDHVSQSLKQERGRLFLVSCTAPCQGMSKNGQGTLLNNIRNGKRPEMDPRNRLILPALEIIKALRPEWIVFENVCEMRNTMIQDRRGKLRPILKIIESALSPGYVGAAYDVEFADYGVAQRRKRLITVYTSNESARRHFADGVPLIPCPTHAKAGSGGLSPWVSVMEAIQDFPPLDSKDAAHAGSRLKFHRVPVLEPVKYEWIRHTPPGTSAFDNQCINPRCRYKGNQAHRANRGKDGINRAQRTTPLYCEKCGALLPRPYTTNPDGSLRIMSGYTSAYRRMEATAPATTLTRNLSYPCSDKKLHPYQNRVLSLAEAMKLHTISEYSYKWGPVDGGDASDSVIRLVIGESIPPKFLHALGLHLKLLSEREVLPASARPNKAAQYQLL